MASKFQNRLVGTIILVALGVIILPGLLDGKKKHYADEFASIPLEPKPGDVEEQETIASATQPLPMNPPEGAKEAINKSTNSVSSSLNQGQNAQTQVLSPPPMTEPVPVATKPVPPKEVVAPKVEPPKPVPVKPVPQKTIEQPKVENKPPVVEKAPVVTEKAPSGQAYVVQLGALKNAARVNEIVAKLRLSGYRAFTVPSTPVQDQITRLFVGPDPSKQKLESSLPDLNRISGLVGGQVRSYSTGQ